MEYYRCDKDGPQYLFPCNEKFSVLQDRCVQQFDDANDFATENPDYGLNGETWSDSIKEVQKQFIMKHRQESVI